MNFNVIFLLSIWMRRKRYLFYKDEHKNKIKPFQKKYLKNQIKT